LTTPRQPESAHHDLHLERTREAAAARKLFLSPDPLDLDLIAWKMT
jgi:hypothetical protein